VSASCIHDVAGKRLTAEIAVLQRVKSASVTVDGALISSIGKGILVFAGLGKDDTIKDAESMADKVLKLKMFEGEEGEKVCR
jgi:D-Tyr-tRNAtyr deacylase